MTGSPSLLSSWADSDFWNLGAFLVSPDGQHVTLGKGGTCQFVKRFIETEAPIFYLKDFYSETYLAYIPESFITISKSHVLDWSNHFQENHGPIGAIANDDDIYEKDFGHLKASFKNGLEKVVLVSRETYYPFENELSIRRLLKRAFHFGTGTPYGFWNKNYGIIGSTPELLYSINQQKIETFALAGTARIGQEEELLESTKDRHEHELVIRDISEKLSPYVKTFSVQETKIHPFKSIIHLRTNVEGVVLPEVDYTELTNTFSPTAALGGYPKDLSLKFLKCSGYSQKYPLRYFGSAFGIMSKETKQFVVAIRNVQWENNHLFIESGGGIVPDSQFQKELEEIHLKRSTIRNHYL